MRIATVDGVDPTDVVPMRELPIDVLFGVSVTKCPPGPRFNTWHAYPMRHCNKLPNLDDYDMWPAS